MSVIKHQYELSIWKDVWARPTLLDDKGNVVHVLDTDDGRPVLDEEKSAILSTDGMTFPGKAINIIFKTKLNGTHELTFDLPGKYIDTTTGKKVKNYLRELIDNETKVKLFYKEKWYSFYVKKVTEKREKNYMTYSYSCEDSFISELSKNGYKITFNEYTEHYIEQIHTFAEDILEGSEWDYDKDKTNELCDLIEYQEEKLIKYTYTGADKQIYPLIGTLDHSKYTEAVENPITLPSGATVFGFYSEANQSVYKTEIVGGVPVDVEVKQFIYIPEDEEVLISGNTIVNKNRNFVLPITELNIPSSIQFQDDRRYGDKIVYSPYSEYNKQLERFVKKYYKSPLDKESFVYSFTKTRIMVPEIATNYAANGKDMVDTTGWAPEVATDKLSVDKLSTGIFTTDSLGYPTLVYDENGDFSPSTYGIIASKLTSKSTGGNTVKVINTGPYSRKLVIDTPTVFALKLEYKWAEATEEGHVSDYWGTPNQYISGATYQANSPKISICQPVVTGIKDSYYSEIVTESSALDDDGNYVFNNTPLITVNSVQNNQYYLVKFTNDMLASGPLEDLFIVIEFDGETNQTLDFCIQSLEFFEAFNYNGGHTKDVGGLLKSQDYIVPIWKDGRYSWMSGYIKYLHGIDPGGNYDETSASYAYKIMQENLEDWEDSIDDFEYTLVTSESIVSGKSFDEEIYFTIGAPRSAFTDPVINYIDPTEDSSYKLLQWYDNYKYRTLKQEKSNRFNLTQELSKLFQVYPCYEIDYYKNGKVKKKLYDSDNNEITLDNYSDQSVLYSKRVKTLYYSDRAENENKYGFKYGHNLNSISRNIDSTDLVSKMFVADNLNQYATDGICTIARAADNIGKDTYLLNFDYFIDRQIIQKDQVTDDLYSDELLVTKSWSNYWTENQPPNSSGYDGLIEDIEVYKGFLKTIGEINSRYDYVTSEKTTLEKYQLIILEASVQTYTSALKALREQLAKQKNLAAEYQKEQVNKKQAEYAASCERIESKIATYEIYLDSAQSLYETYADLYNRYECEQDFLLSVKKEVEDKFNSRYESLIKEGVWQDSKYLNDNSYYLDAEKVLNDSKGPKITYTINVTDLSVLDKYKFTDFNVGDVTYVEDYEFFGDDLEGTDKFYSEKTIVSAITCNLDDPSKNTISLQNYTTKFDDLFSRITASVQSLTFNENIYQRAANFNTKGEVDGDSMQNTLSDNDLTLVGNQDVQIDGNGIVVTDLRIPSNKVKIVGSGVFLTADGGNSWYGALENGGLNASLLTVGAINTKAITIFHENYSNFLWDKEGITAYATASAFNEGSNTTTNKQISHSYVRFNQYGLFFVNSNDKFDIEVSKLTQQAKGALSPKTLEYIMDNADVAITYNGFALNGLSGKVRFSSSDGIVMKDEFDQEVIRLGHIGADEDDDIKDFWGLWAKGAYIEGKLYTTKVTQRTVDFGGRTGRVKVDDISRSMLNGGRLEISKTVVQQDDDDTESRKLKRITTFGAGLFKNGVNDDNGEDLDIKMSDYLSCLGSTIYLHNDAKYWSIASYDADANKYYTRIMYVRKQLSNYEDDTLVVNAAHIITRTAAQVQSDAKVKNSINDIDRRYLKLIDNLQVKTFKYNEEGQINKYHIGLIAQDLLAAEGKVGINPNENHLVSKNNDILSINYSELLVLAIAKIQELENRIKQLEKEPKN